MADVRTLKLWQGRIATELEVAGSGPPLLYLHGPWGLAPDRGFIARLTEGRTVYAPKFPGTSRGDHEAVHALDGWLDLAVYHGELLDALKLSAPAVVGHSFGGLVAAEIAAALPHAVDRLVLIDPVGPSLATRSGMAAAISAAIRPPNEWPTTAGAESFRASSNSP